VFGIAGHWCRRRADRRHLALALVSGVLLGEGVHLTWLVGNPTLRPAGVVEMTAAALILAWSLHRAPRSALTHGPLAVAAVTLAAATSTLAAVEVIDAIFLAVPG
jgi:hypothetical protein